MARDGIDKNEYRISEAVTFKGWGLQGLWNGIVFVSLLLAVTSRKATWILRDSVNISIP